ncbi:MAG: 16S rRNA (uracil(1498)-N(3))-methyltransferase [Lentisphaerae bacterium]|nr:16S rRNA (uracil(1498)-N(3))-methyltransferase [Lentisphaerota bacterium]
MYRCYVDPSALDSEAGFRLSEEEAHHVVHVLRAEIGERVIAFDGRGRETEAAIESREGGHVVLRAAGPVRTAPADPVRVVLVQALPKGRGMDGIVEKATEIGVSEILPVFTARTVGVPREEKRPDRRDRWERISISAAKQCGTSRLPVIQPIESYPDALRNAAGSDLLLVGALTGETRPLRHVLRGAAAGGVDSVTLFIGPEGDLTPSELSEAIGVGAVPVTFGSRVLRCETAALFGLSAIRYEFMGETDRTPSGSP